MTSFSKTDERADATEAPVQFHKGATDNDDYGVVAIAPGGEGGGMDMGGGIVLTA